MDEQQCLDGLELERTIFRVAKDKEHPYLMMAKSAIRDSRISLAARGLLALMLAQPDDWEFNTRHLAHLAGCGHTMVAELVHELIKAGYVRRSKEQPRRGGRFARIRYLVYETPEMPRESAPEDATPPCPHPRTRCHRVRSHRDGATVSGRTDTVPADTTDYSSPETEDRETEKAPSEESAPEEAKPDHKAVAIAWYRRLAKETGKLISPSTDDFSAAKKATDRAQPEAILAAVTRYFDEEWWFTRDKRTKKRTLSFGSFLARFAEILADAPARETGPPRREYQCSCGRSLVFGTARWARCDCGKDWELQDGELVDTTDVA